MRRIQGLDLLRGIAVGLVLLRHALPTPFAGAGVVGVVMFFAVSGYLITGLLLEEHQRTGTVALRRFYRRRAARLVPALLVLVLAVSVVTLLFDPLGDRGTVVEDVLVALTWTGNLPRLTPGGATFHLWTLATEEQFYLVWPAVLLVAVRRGRPARTFAAVGLVCLAACAATLLWLRADVDLAYALPTVWTGCFVIGAAARVYGDRILRDRGLPPCAVPLALATLGVLSVVELRGHALTYLAGGPVIAVLTCTLLLAWRAWTVVDGPRLSLVVWLGTVSYGAYLWNYPLTLWLRTATGAPLGALITVSLTLVAAQLSHRWVERPFLHRRQVPA
ncbi:MAG: acyltransferase [Nocardioidaceae bacterium]